VAVEGGEDFVAVGLVAVDGNVDGGVAEVGRNVDVGDGDGGEVEAAASEDFVEGFAEEAVEEGIEAESAGDHKKGKKGRRQKAKKALGACKHAKRHLARLEMERA
jgi:hypothetical protein